jgi:acetyltransferase-like isoleucine patch superfamily enzyme
MSSAVPLRAKRIRGRHLFRAGRWVLLGSAAAMGLLPRFVAEALLALFRNVPGHVGLALRYVCVRRLAASCGENVAVYAGAHLHDLQKLHLGSNIKIGEMCFLGASGGLSISDDVSIAHATTILTGEHDYTQPGPLRETPVIFKPVRIDREVWIGAGVRILAGAHVGEGSAVGAGSVVTRDVPPYAIVAGVPARLLKQRPQSKANSDG